MLFSDLLYVERMHITTSIYEVSTRLETKHCIIGVSTVNSQLTHYALFLMLSIRCLRCPALYTKSRVRYTSRRSTYNENKEACREVFRPYSLHMSNAFISYRTRSALIIIYI